MKKESTAKYVVRLAVTLLVISGVMAAALAGINAVTAPIIEKLNYEKTQEAVSAVLEGGGDEVAAPEMALVSKMYQGENGYAVEVTPGGFDNTITMMVGVDNEGVSYAILCMNTCVVLLDRIGRPVKFGAPKKEAAK